MLDKAISVLMRVVVQISGLFLRRSLGCITQLFSGAELGLLVSEYRGRWCVEARVDKDSCVLSLGVCVCYCGLLSFSYFRRGCASPWRSDGSRVC